MTQLTGVPDTLAHALAERGYVVPTPVQQAVAEVSPRRRDMLVSAPTGSGKTLAFGIALSQTVLGQDGHAPGIGPPRAMVIVPTRELAHQVRGELGWLFGGAGARVVCCTGGMDMRAERADLQAGCAIVVGSPGRLRDHIERGALDTAGLGCIVLDEADDMLDMGFRDDLEFLLSAAGPERQTLMFSATLTAAIEGLASQFQRDAVRIHVPWLEEGAAQVWFEGVAVAPNDRENAIVNLLRVHEARGAIVFCATREAVAHLASRLDNRGFKVVALSGALPQRERNAAMAAMRDGRARVCVATDLAARGIDLPRLDLVIHADLPSSHAVLTHRSGRTGRAGCDGLAVLVVAHTERRRAEMLIRRAGVSIDWVQPPGPEAVQTRDEARMVAGPDFAAAPNALESAAARRLVARFDAEALAVAYLRSYAAAHPAPELLIGGASDSGRIARKRITDGVWFAINCGRSGQAEVRWLLPLICRLGHVTKHDIGRIVVRERETRFEISAAAAPAFEASVARHSEAGVEIRREHGPEPEFRGPGGAGPGSGPAMGEARPN